MSLSGQVSLIPLGVSGTHIPSTESVLLVRFYVSFVTFQLALLLLILDFKGFL